MVLLRRVASGEAEGGCCRLRTSEVQQQLPPAQGCLRLQCAVVAMAGAVTVRSRSHASTSPGPSLVLVQGS